MFICASDMPVLEEVVSLYLGLGDNPINPLQQRVFLITEPTLQFLSFTFFFVLYIFKSIFVIAGHGSTFPKSQHLGDRPAKPK